MRFETFLPLPSTHKTLKSNEFSAATSTVVLLSSLDNGREKTSLQNGKVNEKSMIFHAAKRTVKRKNFQLLFSLV